MNLSDILMLIDTSLNMEPPVIVRELCGDHYQPYYHFLYLAASQQSWGISVELGVESGRGLSCMAAGNRTRQAVGLDNAWNQGIAEKRDGYGLGNMVYFLAPSITPSMEPYEYIVKCGQKISLLHIDTEHSEAMAKAEFEAYEPFLGSGAIVCFDDLHAQDDSVLKYFLSLDYPLIQEDRLHPVDGYGIMIYE